MANRMRLGTEARGHLGCKIRPEKGKGSEGKGTEAKRIA